VVKLYDYFIESEKLYSDKFLMSNGVHYVFDEDEYKFIEKFICENYDISSKTLDIIGEVLDNVKISITFKYLIFGDFLFSSTSFINPSSYTYTISREDYFYNIRLRASINMSFGLDYALYIEFHKKLLISLRQNNVISRKLTRALKEGVWCTAVYNQLSVNTVNNCDQLYFGKNPFILVDIYGSFYSISSFRNM
jgi:hypothetical protein